MSLWKIAWRSIQRRSLASGLTSLSMALGVMLVVSVLLIMGVVAESFRNNSSLGYNMIVGAKGGRLQLVLNTVFYLSTPVENLPYSFYQEFLSRSERGDDRDGKFSIYTAMAIPVCLGDYYQGYRVVGTTTQMFDDFVYDRERGKKYEFAEGRNFRHQSKEHGYFEGVVGATVARQTGLKVGDTFSPTHGAEGPEHDQFHVVGILKPTGTPNDRALFVNMEGFYLLEGHAKPAPGPESPAPEAVGHAPPSTADNGDPHADDPSNVAHQRAPLPVEEREVTAILLRTVNPLVAPGLTNTINEGPVGQAVLPIAEIHQLFANFVTPIKAALLLMASMICVVSGVSILVSIYNSMNDRRHEIAVMRALGADRRTVMLVVLFESVLLSLGGGLVGWASGHILIGAIARPVIEQRTGVSIGVFDLTPPPQLDGTLFGGPSISLGVSAELLLIPLLILLAIIVGFLPAIAAYRTDVGRALSANP